MRGNAKAQHAGKDIASNHKLSLPSQELDRMKAQAVIMSDDDIARMKQEKEAEFARTRYASQQRKEQMMKKELEVRAHREQLALEMELEAVKNAPLTEEDMLRSQSLDPVRRINGLALQARGYQLCDKLHDAQENKKEFETNYNRRINRNMERDRVQELDDRRAQREADRNKRIEARKMLEEQIAEREKKKIWAEEAKSIEAQKIVAKYKKYEEEEEDKHRKQQEHKRWVAGEIMKTNATMEQMKQEAREREKYEDRVAAAYLKKKAMAEEAKLQEELRIKKAQEIRTAKLRAQQEKAQDKQAIQDAFRAKRAFEDREKQAREKEKKEKEDQKAMWQKILKEREKQSQFKAEARLHEQRQLEVIDKIGQEAVESEYERRRREEEEKQRRNRQYGEHVKQQIESNASKREKERLFAANEGKFEKKNQLKEAIIVEKVRQQALAKLKKEGVSKGYLRELERMKVTHPNQ